MEDGSKPALLLVASWGREKEEKRRFVGREKVTEKGCVKGVRMAEGVGERSSRDRRDEMALTYSYLMGAALLVSF